MIEAGKINPENLFDRDKFGIGISGESGYNYQKDGLEILIKRKGLRRELNSYWGNNRG